MLFDDRHLSESDVQQPSNEFYNERNNLFLFFSLSSKLTNRINEFYVPNIYKVLLYDRYVAHLYSMSEFLIVDVY